jgi:hypothetical protein
MTLQFEEFNFLLQLWMVNSIIETLQKTDTAATIATAATASI